MLDTLLSGISDGVIDQCLPYSALSWYSKALKTPRIYVPGSVSQRSTSIRQRAGLHMGFSLEGHESCRALRLGTLSSRCCNTYTALRPQNCSEGRCGGVVGGVVQKIAVEEEEWTASKAGQLFSLLSRGDPLSNTSALQDCVTQLSDFGASDAT